MTAVPLPGHGENVFVAISTCAFANAMLCEKNGHWYVRYYLVPRTGIYPNSYPLNINDHRGRVVQYFSEKKARLVNPLTLRHFFVIRGVARLKRVEQGEYQIWSLFDADRNTRTSLTLTWAMLPSFARDTFEVQAWNPVDSVSLDYAMPGDTRVHRSFIALTDNVGHGFNIKVNTPEGERLFVRPEPKKDK